MTHIRVIVKMASNMSKTDGELKEPTETQGFAL